MVCQILCQAYLLEVGLMQILTKYETLFIVCYVGVHVHFSFMVISLGLYAFTFSCEVSLDCFPFLPMIDFRMQWS